MKHITTAFTALFIFVFLQSAKSQSPSCTFSDSLVVNSEVTCNGGNNGSITVYAFGTPAYTYSWAPSGGTSATATGLTAGGYTVTITDSKGCKAIDSIRVIQPTAVVVTAAASPDTVCSGSSSNLLSIANGGTSPYTYHWNTGATTSSITVSPTSNTAYVVNVTDSKGCGSNFFTLMVYVKTCTGIKEVGLQDNDINIYPNPGNGVFNLAIANEKLEIKSLEVYNIIGEKIYSSSFSIHNSTFKIDIGTQPAGVYTLRLKTTDSSIITKRLIKTE